MKRKVPVYTTPELSRRIRLAFGEAKNTTKLTILLREDEAFRCRHELDQASLDHLFGAVGVQPPLITSISITNVKSALNVKGDDNLDTGNEVSPNPILREHQQAALDAVFLAMKKKKDIGKIILPTGTGKTRIEAEIIKQLHYRSTTGSGIYVILSPRILLAYQLLNVIGKIVTAKDELFPNGVHCEFLNVNSGEFDSVRMEKALRRLGIDHPKKIDSTLNPEAIVTAINNVRNPADPKPLLIFSTYHSAWKVDEAMTTAQATVNAYIYDEAQYCVGKGEFKKVLDYTSDYKFFFTATEKVTDDSIKGDGMNVESKFGEKLFTETAKTLINRGEMASVAIHLIGAREHVDQDNHESKSRLVTEAFDKHRDVVKQYADNGDDIGPKMLVVCDKQDSLKGIIMSKAMTEYRTAHPTVKLYALSTDNGIYIEGYSSPRVTNRDKEELFVCLSELEPTDEAIVLHVDMVAEGIDVPGITGVMPFRNLGKIKFLQNLGRGTRLVDLDRAGLYAGTITKPGDGNRNFVGYTKPYCWVILPVLDDSSYDAKRRFTDYVQHLRSDYEFDSSELVVIDNVKGKDEEEEMEEVGPGQKRIFNLGTDIITEILHELEEADAMSEFCEQAFEFKKLTATQQLTLIHDIYTQ